METLTFQCGHCNQLMAVGADFLGQQVRCPHCQQVVIAPSHPAPTSPSPDAALDGPMEAHSPAQSPYETAPEAPAGTPPVPDMGKVFGHDPNPRLELAPATPPAFTAFESAVEESTPAESKTAAVGSATTAETKPEAPPSPRVSAAPPDDSNPWTAPTASEPSPTDAPVLPASTARVPRRSQYGMNLFIGLVFLPLVLYSVLVTILAIKFYSQIPSGTPAPTSTKAARTTPG